MDHGKQSDGTPRRETEGGPSSRRKISRFGVNQFDFSLDLKNVASKFLLWKEIVLLINENVPSNYTVFSVVRFETRTLMN